jgi:TonB family protein
MFKYLIFLKNTMADRVGFEPTIPVKVLRISSAVPSTARPPVRRGRNILRSPRPRKRVCRPSPLQRRSMRPQSFRNTFQRRTANMGAAQAQGELMSLRGPRAGLAALLFVAGAVHTVAQSEPLSSASAQAGQPAGSQPTPSAGSSGTCDRYLPANFVLPPTARATLVSLRISVTGDVSDVSLTRSSGNGDLDKAALACVSGWHQAPITVDGKPIDVSLIGGVFWASRLHTFSYSSPAGEPNVCNNSYPPLSIRLNQEGTTTLKVRVAADGSVQNPVVTQSSGYAALDQASLNCAASYRYFPATQNGNPVAIDRQLAFNWRLAHPPLGPMVQMSVGQDGGLLIEGQSFSDTETLKAKLAEIDSRNPRPGLCLVAVEKMSWPALQAVARSTKLLTAAGVPSVRFCTVPFADWNR